MSGPSSERAREPARRFARAWDDYAARARPEAGHWPGDEWGDERLWSAWFRRLFEEQGVASWRRAIEIGPGAGKYTARVLAASEARLLALDVSERFRRLCEQRLHDWIERDRLRVHAIVECDPDPVARSWREAGWEGDVDAVFAIDTLVHLTVTQVAALLLSATSVLAPGGKFVGTFADATSEAGVRKLVADLDRVVRGGGDPATGCFHWSSPEIVRSLARHLGYEVVLCDLDPEHRRDGHFVLRFADAERAAAGRALRGS